MRRVWRLLSWLGPLSAIATGCADDGAAPRDPRDMRSPDATPPGTGGQPSDADGSSSPPPSPTRDAGEDASSTDSDGAPAGEDASPSDEDAGPGFALLKVPGWSVKKQILAGLDQLLLEETLTSFAQVAPGPTRIERVDHDGKALRSYDAPDGAYLSDFCVHPSGQVSAIVIGADRAVTLVRLDSTLAPLATRVIHDPDISKDGPDDGAPADLLTNELVRDAARVAGAGEDVFAVVYSSAYSVIAYRSSVAAGSWSPPLRTLVEPPLFVPALLPTSGSFDTFGAIFQGYRAHLDTDEDGNAFVAIWGHRTKIAAHADAFHDGAAPLAQVGVDSDVLLTRLNRDGTRAWTRVVGTQFEDEPSAVRARQGKVAVVGRTRRILGDDNSAWDAFFSVSSAAGDLVATRTFVFDASSIVLSADLLPAGGWLLGGSDGWSQNPKGLSIGPFGSKLLFELEDEKIAAPVRLPLAAGPRHNEVRSVNAIANRLWYAGHEDGPTMHTGDADHSLIRANGVVGAVDP